MVWPEGKMDTCPFLPSINMCLKTATWHNVLKKNNTKHKTLLYLQHILLLWGKKAIISKLITIVIHYLELCYVLFILKDIYFPIPTEFIL